MSISCLMVKMVGAILVVGLAVSSALIIKKLVTPDFSKFFDENDHICWGLFLG